MTSPVDFGGSSVGIGEVELEPKDLSTISPTSDDDGKIYFHNGNSSITLANGDTTSSRGVFIWDNSADAWALPDGGAGSSGSSSYTDEDAQDATASMLTGGTDISLAYDDANDTLTIDSTVNITAKLFLAEGTNDDINSALDPVSWNGTTFNDSVYTWDGSDRVTIDKAGRYEIHAEADFQSDGSSRQNPNLFVQNNKTIVGVGGRSGYMRDSEGHDHSSVHAHAVIDAASGDTIDVRSTQEADAGSVSVPRASFYIIRLEEDTSTVQSGGYFDGNLTSTQTNAENGIYVNFADSVSENAGWTVDSSSQISPDNSGTYMVNGHVNFHRTGSGNRNIMYAELEINGTTFTGRTRGVCYIRNDGAGDEGDATFSTVISLNAGDDIRIFANQEKGAESGNDIERASLSITRIN